MSESREYRLGPTRAEVLHQLRSSVDPAPVADIASAVGLHPNTTRFHLDALVAAGLVLRETEQRTRPGRPKLLYRAAHPLREDHFQALAHVMVHFFAGGMDDQSALAEAAGLAAGDELREALERANPGEDPLSRLVNTLTDLGYAPRMVSVQDPVIELTPCPYGRVASDDPQVVCPLHRGMLTGLLGPDQPWEVVSVEPWATPETCVVRLARSAAFVDPGAAAPSTTDGPPDA